ncbi:GNAT family N-acetyltransferase [Kitasatospora sp. NPDC092948]|uniref:GNAT family N-acetyltransferase n=1 Tax=Kitasatospora sp. NPDC092948 TaxID=3364088 RepID=UPI0038116F03
MVDDPGFHGAVERQLAGGTALVAVRDERVVGGLLVGYEAAACHLHWLVVDERTRGTGVGRALVTEALARCPDGVVGVEVVTFGADHPGAVASGARVFYERLGFSPAEAVEPGPEGGSRQMYRRTL